MPVFFIPHGGGPCFFMGADGGPPEMWRKMADFLAGFMRDLPERPRAILIISGHWEESAPTVHVGARPDLYYDYYGFPEHTYHLKWDAPGAPDVARRAAELLSDAGFPVAEESDRGWDHGVFIPMMVALPEADIPTIQLSLRADLDPAAHIAMGRALAALRDEGVLIIGSGMSFHNMSVRGPAGTDRADAFDAALVAAVTSEDPQERADRLARWRDMPFAEFAHPREEHLLPLMVATGAGDGDTAAHIYQDHVIGWAVSGFRFG